MVNDIRRFPRGFFFGLFIVAAGLILLLGQMGIISASYIFRFFWPAILIFFGFEGVFLCSGLGRFWGSLSMIAGGIMLLSNLGYIHVSLAIIWPLFMIFWGLWLVMRAFGSGPRWKWEWVNSWKGHTGPDFTSDSADLHSDTVFSSVNRRVTSKSFRRGKIAAIFGEVKIDLTEAEIEGDEAVIHADAVFGAGEIRVPDTWLVSCRGNAVFGEYADRTYHKSLEGSGAKRLIVKGGAVFGSIVVKN